MKVEGVAETFTRAARSGLLYKSKLNNAPFRFLFPFKVGDWIFVESKKKRHFAVIRHISESKIKVYCFDRPNFWYNTLTITERDKISAVDAEYVLTRIFDRFQPFGIQILHTIAEHISEYLPRTIFWKS